MLTKQANFMWDVDTLFGVVPKTRPMDEIKLSGGIQAFKFQSAPYAEKADTWVFAAMGVPATEMPEDGYPAIVLVHGGGGQIYEEWMLYWMRKGFVTIALDMFGHELSVDLQKVDNAESGPKEGDGSNYDGVENPKNSWVYHSVHNVIMAHNLLRARGDVDKKKIVITGVSWGGYITNIVAGVDDRFAAFSPMYGSGFVYEDSCWTTNEKKFGGEAHRAEWVKLYDPSSYLPNAAKPMLYISGVDDAFFSTVSRAKSAALVKGEVYYSQRSELPHGHCWMLAHEIPAFFRQVLYGGNSYVKLNGAAVQDGVATLRTGEQAYKEVNFVYTLSTDEDSHKWKWETILLTVAQGEYACKIPDGATAYLFETCQKETGEPIYQSTPVYFTNDNKRY
jgi:dienelactone hydrolase